jgi:hypothetical protein
MGLTGGDQAARQETAGQQSYREQAGFGLTSGQQDLRDAVRPAEQPHERRHGEPP